MAGRARVHVVMTGGTRNRAGFGLRASLLAVAFAEATQLFNIRYIRNVEGMFVVTSVISVSMETASADAFRKKWGQFMKAAIERDVPTALTWRDGQAEAVMMSYGTWEEGRRNLAVDEVFIDELGSDQAKTQLLDVRIAANRGRHTVIVMFKNKRRMAAIAPIGWTLEALPHLGEPVYPEPVEGQRYRAGRASDQ